MTRTTFFKHFDLLADQPHAVAKLRKLVLQLAVQGKIKIKSGEGEFSRVRLDSLGDWALGCGFPTTEQGHTDRPILFSKVSDMNLEGNEREILTTNHTIDEETANRLRIKAHPPGTVIFPKIGGAIATNKRRMLVKPTAIDNNCLGIIPNKSCTTEWLFVVLSAIDFTAYQSGTSVPALNQGSLGEIEVSLPPLAGQRRIVAKVEELLALCDELETRQTAAREHRTRFVRSALDHLTTAQDESDFKKHSAFCLQHSELLFDSVPALRQAILSLAVQGRLVPQNPKDEPASELIARVRKQKNELIEGGILQKEKPVKARKGDAMLFAIPKSWQWTRLSEFAELITKGSSPKWQGISYVTKDEGVLFVTSENVGNYQLRKLDDLKYVEKRFNQIEPRSMLKFGDILMNLVGASIGRTAVYNLEVEANINQAVALIRLMPGITADFAEFLLHYLNSPPAIEHMLSSQVVNAQPNISLTDSRDFPVPLPPLAEQQRIVAKVDELLRWCDALEARLTAARTTATHLLDSTLHHILAA
jgi:type I restriction enzyme S subunit